MISVFQVNKWNNGPSINVVMWSNQLPVKRMHYSRVRTTHLLTVSRSVWWEVCAGEAVPTWGNLPRGCLPRVCLPGGVCLGGLSA